MKPFRIALVLICLTAFPALAADHVFDLTGWVARVDPNSSDTFNSSNPNEPFNVRFDGKLGYGIGANIFFGGHLSTAFDAVQGRPGTTVRTRAVGGGSLLTNGTRMTSITGILQWHFAPSGGIDPYVGAGAAYVLFDKTNVFHSTTLSHIDYKDDVGLALNAGIAFRISRMLALTADGKYVPLKSSAKAVYLPGSVPTLPTDLRVKVNPVIFSGGLTLRF
jgi:outer membrane protein